MARSLNQSTLHFMKSKTQNKNSAVNYERTFLFTKKVRENEEVTKKNSTAIKVKNKCHS